jgi:hypothetical protein
MIRNKKKIKKTRKKKEKEVKVKILQSNRNEEDQDLAIIKKKKIINSKVNKIFKICINHTKPINLSRLQLLHLK